MAIPTFYIQIVRLGIALVFGVVLSASVRAQEPVPHVVVFDRYMSPAAGAQNILTIQHLLAKAEDRWLPLKLGAERSRTALALGIVYRGGKFLALDMPQDHFLLVAAHEIFGHGARFRELGEGSLRYGFDAPIPYGSGDAFTRFNGRFPISPLAEMNVSASGMEAQHSLADAIAERAVARGRIHYREAWLYFESRMAAMNYILSASPTSSEGHDAASFLETFEKACDAPCSPITRNQMQRRSLLALVDPLLYYSMYSLAVSYIGGGSMTGPMPLVPVGGGYRLVPSLGYALAPYGTEWTVRAAFQQQQKALNSERRLTNISLRVGNTGASSTWGVGARAADVVTLLGLRVGVSAELWRQPELLAEKTSNEQSVGGSAMGTLILPLPPFLRSPFSDGIHVSAGYKSQGFVPGEQLGGGGVLRAGIVLR